ncbi:MAG: hypothetical protein IKP46_04040 [Bacteroidales bacterium]|nr:hypothetical protein [Bacteroidales bacterium]
MCTEPRLVSLLVSATLLLAVSFSLSAQKVSAGALFSPKGCGVVVEVPAAGGECTATFEGLLDFSGLLLGKVNHPGGMFRFFYDYTFFRKPCGESEGEFTVYAGPGAMLGYVRERDGIFGPAVALSGEFGIAYSPKPCVRLSLEINADLGLHFDVNNSKTRIYLEGLTRAWMPSVGIMYCF